MIRILLFLLSFPIRLLYRILLSICILFSYLKDILYHCNIDTMNGIEFEHFTKELLQQNHFQHVELTKASNDYGIDILAMKNDTLYAIQCKKYKNKVGIDAVRQAATGCLDYDQDIAVVFTNSTFSSQARKLAETLNVELWDYTTLQQLRKRTTLIKRRKCIAPSIFLTLILLLILLYMY